MARLVSPDRGCVQADVGPTRYNGRIVDTDNAFHARALREVGYFDASLGGVTKAKGRRCDDCGFNGFFVVCGRCGGNCQ